MSIEKAELKRLTVQEVAKRVESLKRKSSADVESCGGGIDALNEAAKGVLSVRSKWKRALTEETITPKTHETIVEVTEECLGCIRNLIIKYENIKQQVIGEIRMADKSISVCQRIFDEEESKIIALESGEEIDARQIGSRPSQSIAAQRKQEEKQPIKKKIVRKKKKNA